MCWIVHIPTVCCHVTHIICVTQQIKEVAGKLDVEMMVIQGEELNQKGFGGIFIMLYIVAL